jgi:putative ABC transport system permease protein
MTDKRMGVDMKDMIILPLRERKQMEAYEKMKAEMNSIPGIQDITSASVYLGIFEQRRAFLPEGRPRDDMWMINHVQADANYLEVMKANLVQGRYFSDTDLADSASIIINKTLLNKLEWKDPLNKTIAIPSLEPDGDQKFRVVGVIDDFHFASLHSQVEPLIVMNNPSLSNFMIVKTEEGKTGAVVPRLETLWETMFPESPFDHFLQEDKFKVLYANDFRMRRIFLLFTCLAIFIASMGIFGLALLSATRKTREIGIRKVYGSSVINIVLLLSKRLLVLIIISCMIAFPFAWYYLQNWLAGYAYHIAIPAWAFLAGGSIAIFAGLMTVVLTSLKAARRNPIKALRYE